MSVSQESGRPLRISATILLALICFSSPGNCSDKTYSPETTNEIAVLSLVLASEVQANNGTKDDLICFSVDGKDPANKLIKTLRQRGLNVGSPAEWRRKFTCGFQARLTFIDSDSSQVARIHAEISDFRDINSGAAHFAARVREGEYLVRTNGRTWAISDYLPLK
jgi:hypothetical protein